MYKILLFLSIFIIAGCSYLELAKEELQNGDELSDLREYDRALMHYKSALKLTPQDPEIKMKIAGIYQRMEKNDEAINWFNAIIAEHPDYYGAYYGLWATMLATAENETIKENRKQQIKTKLESLLRNAQERPSDKLYSMAYGVFMELEDYNRAEENKKLLLANYPESKELDDVGQESFERILAVGSELSKRAPLCEIFVKEFPHNKMTASAYRIALTYYWKDVNIKTKVESLCRQWISSSPDDPFAFYMASRVYTEMGIDLQQTIKWGEECAQLIKNDKTTKPFWYDEWQYRDAVKLYQAYDALGWAYYNCHDYDKAEQYLKRALEANAFGSDILWYHLGKVYETTGRFNDALNAMSRSLMCRGDIPEVRESLMQILPKVMTQFSNMGSEELLDSFYQAFAASNDTSYFVDISEKSGLAKSGGRKVAWGDYDNDGYQDLLVDGCHLLHNKGDGTFEEITSHAGITGSYSGGVWADYNNDGWLDFFSAGIADAVWRNNGNNTFTDVTPQLGKISDGYPTEGAAWGDYNRDGFVDLYMANHEKPGQLASGTPDFLWENVKGKWFRDVTLDAGIISQEPMCGRGVVWGDYNNDGWPDIFVANYRLDPDFLWRNNGNGTFNNVARETGVEGAAKNGCFGHSIGADFGDFNNDGNLDLFIANLAHPRYIEFSNMSYLMKNSGAPDYKFNDFRQSLGIRYEETHSNPAWCDYDNDGLLDLYITSVYPTPPSFLYKQTKSGRFADVTWVTGTRLNDGYGCAWADFDNDGDMDLVVAGKDKKDYHLFLFRNETTKLLPERHWLEVKLVGKATPPERGSPAELRELQCNRSAIGARVTVTSGQSKYTREVEGGFGTTCQNSLVQHFGLGKVKDKVSVSVRWPCGKIQELTTAVDRIITVQEK